MLTLALIATAGLFLAWYFVRRARFNEKISLIEKGIDLKDLNLIEGKKPYSPWLRLGIIITGTALGVLLTSIIQVYSWQARQAIILLFVGISVILAYFIDRQKNKN